MVVFLLDRLLSSGKDRPTVFVSADMQIPLPLSESDFAFGDIRSPRTYLSSRVSVCGDSGTTNNYFAITLQGVDIWEKISKWRAEGEKRQSPCPSVSSWSPESAWSELSCDLENWYICLDERARYAPAKVMAQMHQSRPEAFVFINILYYLW